MTNSHINIFEVGPRDGLQNEKQVISSGMKVELVNQLTDCGIKNIEVSSFVNPKRIPQLADATEVFENINRDDNVIYSALVPNVKGFERALESQVNEIAVFTAVSETFCQKNINCSVNESLQRFEDVVKLAEKHNIRVRAYISCVLGCPYEGFIPAQHVSNLCESLKEMGCYQISLGDTIGGGTPTQAKIMLETCANKIGMNNLAIHFHDTRGTALANILACLQLGVENIDSSIAGLGGCPYATGATGNVSTEDVVFMLHGMGYHTGIDLNKLIEIGNFISQKLGRVNQSHVGNAGVPNHYASYQ